MRTRFSFQGCRTFQRHCRVAAAANDGGVTVMLAYEIAEQALDKLFREAHPDPAPAKSKVETACTECGRTTPPKPKEGKLTPLPGLGGPDVTIHREKSFKFADGTVTQCCSATGCGWGRTTKNHSDGMKGGTLYALDLDEAALSALSTLMKVEASEDAVEDEESEDSNAVGELSVEEWASAHPTGDEDGKDEDGNAIESPDDEDAEEKTGDEATWYEELHDER